MLVREARAILAKIPDDASFMVSINGTRINVEAIGYSKNGLNIAAAFLDPIEIKIAITGFIQKEIDGL